ncbi:MAG: tryptophan synthase subunit alpha [Oscillospiraceae bacterium]|jgi:tryptophan synthase alpha chain|nr:tryptophan synthase subunit alpha [Oscillospiraceae bacterium]
MSRIEQAFSKGKAFIAFLTGGDPSIADTERYILEMAAAGADLIEIGVPFSDPVAEGPVIEEANLRALKHNTNLDDLFELVKRVRTKIQIPLVFLTYLNPVFKRGYSKFFNDCAEYGVDGVIIPDMPMEERGEALPFARAAGVDIISLIAPTSKERARQIASEATGFIYIVSSMGTTGVRSSIDTDIQSIINEVRSVTNVPAAVGFGVNTPQQAAELAKIADGVIVGSAIVRLIAQHGSNADAYIKEYISDMSSAAKGL